MSKSIAFLLTRLQDKAFFGGGETISFNLIKNLCEKGYKVDVYCAEKNIEKDYGMNQIIVKDLCESDLIIKELFQKGYYTHTITENHLYPNDITLAHGHSVLYRQKKARNIIEQTLSKFFKGSKNNFIEHQKKCLGGNNIIIVPSKICKHDYSNYLNIDEDKIKVIYPAVNIPESNRRDNNVFTFGLSAPGFANKGGYLLLKALFLLKFCGKNFKAKIIYPGYKKNSLVKILVYVFGLKEKIEFLDIQSDMQDFYNSIDCLVVASNLETFGMVILEAMANSLPVVVSSRCGGAEIIKDKINGFIFNYEKINTFSLLSKLNFILKNKKALKTISQNALETAKTYNWDNYCDNFINAINKK